MPTSQTMYRIDPKALTRYAMDRLRRLHGENNGWPADCSVAVRGEDWPDLLTVYGDAAVFQLIDRCKARLGLDGRPARLVILIDRGEPADMVALTPGNPAFLRLPLKGAPLAGAELLL